MKFEIEIHNGEPMVSSLNIAIQFKRPHADVLKAIRNVLAEGEFSLGEYIDANNQSRPLILLNERSALIAMPYLGGNKSKEGQVALVDGYLAYRAALKPQLDKPLTAAQNYLVQAQINVELEQTQIQQANEIAEIKDTVSTFSK